jgi:hypothetical protein
VRKASKSLPLNEKELREQFSDEEVKKLDLRDNPTPEDPMDGGAYKFKRNFTNNEVLSIMEDFITEGMAKLKSK